MVFLRQTEIRSNGLVRLSSQELGSGRGFNDGLDEPASLEKTIANGKTHFWSRSRQKFG